MGMFLIQGSFSTKLQHDLFYHYIVSCLGSFCWCLEGHGFFRDSVSFPHTEHHGTPRQFVNGVRGFQGGVFFVGHHLSMMISITTTYDLCLFYIIFHRSDRSDAWNWLSLWR